MKEVTLGKCRFCGSDTVENERGWGCSNYRGGCKAFIWKEDKFFQKMFGRNIKKQEAVRLLEGKEVKIKDAVIKGKKTTAVLLWGHKEGKYPFGYTMNFENVY